MGIVEQILAHPLTRGMDVDDPRTTALRRRITREKAFLHKVYAEWYTKLIADLPCIGGDVLEVGADAGLLKDYLPDAITSEVFHCPGIDLVADAQRLPLPDRSLRGMLMTDVLHHLPQPRRFFAEATRCIRAGGVIAMIEPWVNSWATLIFQRLHHGPFRPDAEDWELPPGGVLSMANGAMPWIIFERDRARFEREFPEWEVRAIEPLIPPRYMLSGGVSMRSLMPGWSFGIWRALERPLDRRIGMFARIVLVRR